MRSVTSTQLAAHHLQPQLLAWEMPDLHWRHAGRFRRGEVTEGCAGGAEGRSKRLICLRRTWMEDTGGKSGRRPGRHLQVEASSPGGMLSSREYEETYIVANALVHPFPVTPPANARAARRGHHHHAVVLLHQHEKRKGKEGNVATATRVLVRLVGHRGHRDQKRSSRSAPPSAATRRAASSTRPACRARRRAA